VSSLNVYYITIHRLYEKYLILSQVESLQVLFNSGYMCNESFYHELTHYQMLPRKEKLGLEGFLSFNTLAKKITIYNYPSNLVISSLLAHFQIFELECALSFAYSNPHLYCNL